MRNTWFGYLKTNAEFAQNIAVIFYIGSWKQFTEAQQITIQKESQEYDDILQFDVTDTIYNATWKTFALFEWISFIEKTNKDNQGQAPIILKINDQSVVNADILLPFLSEIRTYMNSLFFPEELPIYGSIINSNNIEKNINQTFYVPQSVWPYKKWGFDYLSGNGYILTIPTIERMLALHYSCFRTVIFIENVFFTGYLADILNIKLIDERRIYSTDQVPKRPQLPREYRNYAVIAEFNSSDFLNAWLQTKANSLKNAILPLIKCTNIDGRMQSNLVENPFCSFFHGLELPISPNEACQIANSESYTYRY